MGEIDQQIYEKALPDYFKAIEEALKEDDSPFLLLPKSMSSKRLIFSSFWDKPVINQPIAFKLQVFTSRIRRWRTIEMWIMPGISEHIWSEVMDYHSCCETEALSTPTSRRGIKPAELYSKIYAKKVSIPNGGFGTKPKYLRHGEDQGGHAHRIRSSH